MILLIRIAIVDDSESDAQRMLGFLSRYYDGDASKYKATHFQNGVLFLEHYSAVYDVVFLDIEMEWMDGMETARRLRAVDSRVILIFTTKMAQYAAYGYDVDAIGYLLKPIDYFSMALKMEKAVQLLKQQKGVMVLLSMEGEKRVVSSREIVYIEVIDHHLVYHTTQGAFKLWGSLKDCAVRLENANFVPCNRYCLVNLEHIQAMTEDLLLVGTTKLPVSRMKRKLVMQALTEYYGGGRA